MLHHVTLEVSAGDITRFTELLAEIGFEAVPAPPPLAADFRWFERAGTQVHLALVDTPEVPSVGHPAFVVAPLDPVVERLRELGFDVSERRRHWGSRRVVVGAPAGHRIELMEEPPAPGQADSGVAEHSRRSTS